MAKKSSKKRSSKKTSAKKFNYIFLLFIIIIIVGLLIHESNPSYISQKSDYLKKEYSSLKKNISVSKEIDKSVAKELSDIAKSAKKETVKTKDVIVEKASEEKKTESSFPKVPEMFNIRSVKDLDIPTLTYQRPSQLIKYKGFTVSFNKDSKVPNWVGYELTSEETKGTIKRTNKFVKDIKAIGCPTNSDYTRSGYDRGHIAPAADMAWDSDAMRESFYFTNMCPQEPILN